MKKRWILVAAGVLLALTPAAAGAIGNTSLSHRVPVSGPIVTTEPGDDNGGLVPRDQRTEPGDDRDATASPTPSPSASPTPAVSPGTAHDAGDDKGGLTDRDQRTEPGDDRDSGDRSGHGRDDSSGHDAGDDHGGSRHGGDDD